MSTIPLYCVGGFVRDKILDKEPHDVDFAVIAKNYEYMKSMLLSSFPGLDIRQEDATFGRLLAGIPVEYLNYSKPVDIKQTIVYADFVLARIEGDYIDGKRPNLVIPAQNIFEDLSRRDFTMNAIAVNDATGEIIDPYMGVADIAARSIVTVGDPFDRFNENPVRILRALRFAVTKRFNISYEIHEDWYTHSTHYAELLKAPLFRDVIYNELSKALKYDTVRTLNLLHEIPAVIRAAFFDVIRLRPDLTK